MTTVKQLRDRLGRMLSDVTLQGYTEGLVYDAIGAALDAILPWVPKTATAVLTGTGAYTYTLPVDTYQVEACVVESTGEILPNAVLVPGYYRGDNLSGTNDWIEYPYGSLTFSKALTSGETYKLYYLAHWSKPVDEGDDEDVIEAPDFTLVGLTLYATSYMINPNAISASEVRQYATKVDSGNPEHNPMQRSATYLIKLFIDEMNRHPRHQKAQR